MKRYFKPLSFVFVLTLLSSSLHAQQTTTVVRIVDGDTLKVRYWGKEESIRLIGIDTPTTSHKSLYDTWRRGESNPRPSRCEGE
jgi:endonuclease YncB( thermonuclease family)